MNKGLKISLYLLGLAVVVVGGVVIYRKYRMTSGNPQKDKRKIVLKRANPNDFQTNNDTNVSQDEEL